MSSENQKMEEVDEVKQELPAISSIEELNEWMKKRVTVEDMKVTALISQIISEAVDAMEWEKKNFTQEEIEWSKKWKTEVTVTPLNPADFDNVPDVDEIIPHHHQ